MRQKKVTKFKDSEIEKLTARFKILSSKSRLKILNILADGELTVTEIVDRTGLVQPNVSKHLKILCINSIVENRRDGREIYYHIVDNTVIKICKKLCSNNT